MNWINTSEFAKIGKFSKQTAWRKIKAAPEEYTKIDSGVCYIKESYAQKLIHNNNENYFTPEHVAKQVGCSPPLVRKTLSLQQPEFAEQLPNRRWRIRDCVAYHSWVELLKKKTKKIRRKTIKSGKDSGIVNYHGIVVNFKRWQEKVGGINGPLEWPTSYQIEFIKDTIQIARQRHTIIDNLSNLGLFNSLSELTESERYFFNKNQKKSYSISMYAVGD